MEKASFPLTIPRATSGNEISKEPDCCRNAFSPGAMQTPVPGTASREKGIFPAFPGNARIRIEEVMQNAARKLEVAANIAIVVVACVAVMVLIRNYRASSAQPPTVKTGAQFALKNANWTASPKNMVLAVSTTCHFCTESAPFYRTLVEQCRRDHVKTIAVLPQPVKEAEAYLKGEGVSVDEIRQSPLSDVEVSGTPTLVLVDDRGVVRSVWVGKLPSDKEKEVLKKVSS